MVGVGLSPQQFFGELVEDMAVQGGPFDAVRWCDFAQLCRILRLHIRCLCRLCAMFAPAHLFEVMVLVPKAGHSVLLTLVGKFLPCHEVTQYVQVS